MGIAIKDLLVSKELDIKDLAHKVLVVDTPILLYQFLTTIRQADGTYLTDSKGQVTSHLVGLLSRVTKLLNYQIKLVFVFDGTPPELKSEENKKRKLLKEEAEKKYKIALEQKDFAAMKKYASRSVKVTPEIIEETKAFLSAFGLPVIQAPSEAEAQASHMVKKGDAYAVATQDTDPLLFGCPRVVKNLSLLGKHKRAGKLDYQQYKPEILELDALLTHHELSYDQFVHLAILVGTDFNTGGIKGIGPKNALKLVREFSEKEKLLSHLGEIVFDFDEVKKTIETIPVTDDYSLEWKGIDKEKIMEILVEKHDFSKERVMKSITELEHYQEQKKQTSLADFG